MNSGLYAALSGNISAMRRLEIVTNNLANANTAGFKKDRLQFESLLNGGQQARLTDTPVLSAERFYTDYSAGPQRQTGNTLDLALEGEGFFVINTPEGRAYTRQGNFKRDAGGKLVTIDGHEVLGNGGPINIGIGKVDIDARGAVVVNGEPVGMLQVVDFPKPYALQKIGNAMFIPANQAAPQPAARTLVAQGALEESNVNTVLEMANMIEANRYFETCQKVVKGYDDMTAKAANELGKV
ncbi:flagellar basal-body rod protein FlgF [Geobacter sp. DSM 9736]|uniref:flagellar basal-body rod protein FlgF n=1 Tax=Geobacter sp. DSM 9736 TaxID=1277350 RepID=UPI000B512DB2|nr:flagellar basal-body rod protein FlgF [Geobacter sp. DSM 9736]SNB47040.1 flagellar basal-body rod protein FlgG [Geobacter sp. DSM 9736]